jgi:hypothetical protein
MNEVLDRIAESKPEQVAAEVNLSREVHRRAA